MTEILFNSPEIEIEYWKKRANDIQDELIAVQEEFQNYEISSRELEQELELQLNDFESRNKTLIVTNEKLGFDLENTKLKLSENAINLNHQMLLLQEEISKLKSDKSTLQKYVRELEQTNDDLERAYRITVGSLQDFEEKLNVAIEKNVILENELEEKETLVETVQRLKDEARDLRQDLEVKEVTLQHARKSQQDEALFTSMIEEPDDSLGVNKACIATQTDISYSSNSAFPSLLLEQTNPTSFYYRSSSGQISFPRSNNTPLSPTYSPLTPAARISALNIVSDMLRKVGAIEHKLTSAAQRGFSESDSSNPLHVSRSSSNHRMSEGSVLMNGYVKHDEDDAFELNASVTPVASPLKSVNGFDKVQSTQITQKVFE